MLKANKMEIIESSKKMERCFKSWSKSNTELSKGFIYVKKGRGNGIISLQLLVSMTPRRFNKDVIPGTHAFIQMRQKKKDQTPLNGGQYEILESSAVVTRINPTAFTVSTASGAAVVDSEGGDGRTSGAVTAKEVEVDEVEVKELSSVEQVSVQEASSSADSSAVSSKAAASSFSSSAVSSGQEGEAANSIVAATAVVKNKSKATKPNKKKRACICLSDDKGAEGKKGKEGEKEEENEKINTTNTSCSMKRGSPQCKASSPGSYAEKSGGGRGLGLGGGGGDAVVDTVSNGGTQAAEAPAREAREAKVAPAAAESCGGGGGVTIEGKPLPPPPWEVVIAPPPVSTGTRHSTRPSLPITLYSDTSMHNSSSALISTSSSSSSAHRGEPTLLELRQHFAEKEVGGKHQALKVGLKLMI
jgi:hypothetical protein